MVHRVWWVLLASSLAASNGSARTLGSVNMPDQVKVGDRRLALNGMGVREATIFKVDVYVAGLYLEKRSNNPTAIIDSEQTKRIHMQFVREVDRKDLIGAFHEAFRKNGAPAQARDGLRQLDAWVTSVQPNDTLTITYRPGHGTEVQINGQIRGEIAGSEFAASLWAVWLGDNPPNAGLKTGLLGSE